MHIQLTYFGSVLADKLASSWPWYMTRATGIVAAILMTILIMSGIGLLTGLTYRFLEPLTAWATHRAIGIAFTVAAFVHVFSLLFDKFVGFNLWDLLIPFKTTYQPARIGSWQAGSFYIALGIIALYLTIAIIVTSIVWVNQRQKLWRLTHYTSYIVLVFVFLHGMFSGTDLKKGIFRIVWVVGGIIVAYAVLRRLLRAGTIMGGKKS